MGAPLGNPATRRPGLPPSYPGRDYREELKPERNCDRRAQVERGLCWGDGRSWGLQDSICCPPGRLLLWNPAEV